MFKSNKNTTPLELEQNLILNKNGIVPFSYTHKTEVPKVTQKKRNAVFWNENKTLTISVFSWTFLSSWPYYTAEFIYHTERIIIFFRKYLFIYAFPPPLFVKVLDTCKRIVQSFLIISVVGIIYDGGSRGSGEGGEGLHLPPLGNV